MKLYATITSERATKGQGGNDYIIINLNVQNGSKKDYPIGEIELIYNNDVENPAIKNCNQNEWVLQYKPFKVLDEWTIIDKGNVEPPKNKGERQKGDN